MSKLSVIDAEYCTKPHYAQCRYAEYCYAECRGALICRCLCQVIIITNSQHLQPTTKPFFSDGPSVIEEGRRTNFEVVCSFIQ